MKNLFGRPSIRLLLIAILGLLIYSNTLGVPFIMDEKFYIAENPVVKDLSFFLSPSKAGQYEFHYEALRDRYIGYLSFALNYKCGGLNVRGYHLINISVHIANALLVYIFASLILMAPSLKASRLDAQRGSIAFLSALLFAVHPVQTGAVTYIYQRFALFVTLFYLGSLAFYLKWRLEVEQQRGSAEAQQATRKNYRSTALPLYGSSLLFALLAVKTKENAFTLPLAIGLVEFMFFDGSHRTVARRAAYILPFALAAAIIPLSVVDAELPFAEAVGGATMTTIHISRHDYLITQLPVMATYIRLLFFPVGQNFDYDYPVYTSIFVPKALASAVLLAAIFVVSAFFYFRLRKREPAFAVIAFGVLWFFTTLSVESSVITLADPIYEHRLYLPSAGFFLALPAGVFMILAGTGNKKTRAAASVAAATIILMLSALTYSRNSVWGDGVSLWEDVLRKSPKKARGYFGLAYAYEQKGMPEKAREYYAAALGPAGGRSKVQTEIAINCWRKGQRHRAVEHLKDAVLLNPASAVAHYNLAVAYASLGKRRRAEEQLNRSLSLDPTLSSRIDSGAFERQLPGP